MPMGNGCLSTWLLRREKYRVKDLGLVGKRGVCCNMCRYALVWTCFLVAACVGFSLSQFGYIYFEQHPELWTSTSPGCGSAT